MQIKGNLSGQGRAGFMMILFITACSSPKYGTHFQEYNTKALSISSSMPTTLSTTFEVDKSSLFTSSIHPAPSFSNNRNAIQLKNLQKTNKESSFTNSEKCFVNLIKNNNQYLKTRKSFHIENTYEMPRWRYLSMAGILLFSGIVLVALSSASTFLGVLATLAFTGALVYLILWMIKK
jgi:hypothetical protein